MAFPSEAARGLTAAEVAERVASGRVNDVPDAPVRTLGEIVRANVLTPINGIIGTLFVLILAVGRPKDSVFAAVIVSCTLAWTFMEVWVFSRTKVLYVEPGATK